MQIYGERIWRHKLILLIVVLAVLIYELLAIYGPIGPHLGDLPSFFTRDQDVEEALSSAPVAGCIELNVTFARVFDDETGAVIFDASWRSETRKGTVLAQLEEGHDMQYVIATNTLLREIALKEGWSPGEVHQITITADKRGYQKVELDLEFSTGPCGGMIETRGYTDIRLVRDDAATPR